MDGTMRRPPVFTIGDRIKLTAAARTRLELHREAQKEGYLLRRAQPPGEWRATVTGFGRTQGTIVIQRDGLKSRETFPANLFQLLRDDT